MNSRAADYYHPIVTFTYAVSLALMAMLFFHPVFILLGLFFAVIQNIMLNGIKPLLRQLCWTLPMCLIVSVFNPIVNSGGKTLLFYLFGNPVTFEAVFYGVCQGGMLLLIFLWFSIYNKIVTPDKFLYLFSHLAPSASMLVMMTQRMIPEISRRLSEISSIQKTLFPADKQERKKSRFVRGLHEISIMLNWSMEDGLDTADSMKARGYGGKNRTSFSIYRFTLSDAAALVFIIIFSVICIILYYGFASVTYFPRVNITFGTGSYLCAAVFSVIAATLPFVEAKFTFNWKRTDVSAARVEDRIEATPLKGCK